MAFLPPIEFAMVDMSYLPAGPQFQAARRSGVCPAGCWPEGSGCYCDYYAPHRAALRGFGNAGFSMITPSWAPLPASSMMPQLQGPWAVARGLEPPIPTKFRMFATLASAAVSAYHGTRRNGGSIFWGTIWFSLGAIFPVITPVVAVAQGLGECRNNCPVGRTVNLGRGHR